VVSAIFTGMTWVTFWKFPELLGLGKQREHRGGSALDLLDCAGDRNALVGSPPPPNA
jgi:hypothetical protein